MHKWLKKIIYPLLCIVAAIFLEQCIGFYLYTAQYQHVSSYISASAAPENFSNEHHVIDQIETVYLDHGSPTLSQIVYYPEQRQVVLGVINPRFSDDRFVLSIKSSQGLELGTM